MKMGDESYFQICRFQGCNVTVEHSRLRATHHAGPKIDKICVLINHNNRCGPGKFRIWHRRPCAEQHDSCSARAIISMRDG